MGRKTKLKDLVGVIKDKASQSKAVILSKPSTHSLHLALLRATTHDPFTLPNPKHVHTFLSFGHSSRATASTAIEALMDRLQSTHDSSVALKCLILVHCIVKHGSFILRDQLSVFPSNGGRNYLKLSDFRDTSSPITWELSTWIRWYAEYIESLLCTSRVLGFFLGSFSDKDRNEERVSALLNYDLIRETESLVSQLEVICRQPESLHLNDNLLVGEIRRLVGKDSLSAMNEISVRVHEFGERLSYLSFGDSVELVCELKRLEDCKEKLMSLSTVKKEMTERLWIEIGEIRGRIDGKAKENDDRLVKKVKGERLSDSARFGERVMRSGDSVRFSSARFAVNYRFSLPIIDSME
ncbi:hypothetical protein FEM48_Zijuj08G0149400 [Ziziphus jujuba var. spinosa]|uniref:ENTH domain-containing protein n=1 Tax=Ziziphus jujuba var. spinosa TaxID=714518 RepID=A0A978UZS4_ZIZJJ|nr:hypothetical protein FEM48_Zijuj08G0149400 [Ziziphus jujuba var. spinosa]